MNIELTIGGKVSEKVYQELLELLKNHKFKPLSSVTISSSFRFDDNSIAENEDVLDYDHDDEIPPSILHFLDYHFQYYITDVSDCYDYHEQVKHIHDVYSKCRDFEYAYDDYGNALITIESLKMIYNCPDFCTLTKEYIEHLDFVCPPLIIERE